MSFGKSIKGALKGFAAGPAGAVTGGLFGSGALRGALNPKDNVYEPRYPVPELFKKIPGLENLQEGDINSLTGRLMPTMKELMGRARGLGEEERGIRAGMLPRLQAGLNLPGVPQEDELWEMQRRRLLETLRSGMAARGLATSGPGIAIEGQQVGELANVFGTRAFERGLSRREAERNALSDLEQFGTRGTEIGTTELDQMKSIQEGIAKLETLPIELRQQLIQILLSQQGMTPAVSSAGSPLTQVGGFIGNVGQGAGGIKALFGCWVAREIYGVDNPTWLIFRYWMMNESPTWFKNLYLKYGERFAKLIHDKPVIKFVIKQWMDMKVMEVLNGRSLAR